jgi:hypothetical protein
MSIALRAFTAALMIVLGFAPGSNAEDAVADGNALAPLFDLLKDLGQSSPDGALMVWVGYDSTGSRRPGDAAGLYLYGSGLIHWRLEEWVLLADGSYRVMLWKFSRGADPDHASLTEIIYVPGGSILTPRYEEPIALDSPEAGSKSAKAIKLLLAADRESRRHLPEDAFLQRTSR